MKLVLISDTHCLHERIVLPEGDVLIHAGDFCGWGHARELAEFCAWLAWQPFEHKILVAGNHDRIVEFSRFQAEFLMRNAGATYLQDSGTEIDGVNFWGCPWTPEFLNWSFMKRRGVDIDKVYMSIPEQVDVLISHGPPQGILDATENGEHIGCEMLAQRLAEGQLRPRLLVCGHNHAGFGTYQQNGITYLNVAQTNEAGANNPYRLVNRPVAWEMT